MTYQDFVAKYNRQSYPMPSNNDEDVDDDEQTAWEHYCGELFWEAIEGLSVQLILCESCGQPIEDLICPHCRFVHKFDGEMPY